MYIRTNKTLYLVHVQNAHEPLCAYLRKSVSMLKDAEVLYFGRHIPLPLKQLSCVVRSSEDVLDRNSYEKIDRKIFDEYSTQWWTKNKKLSSAFFVEYDFQKFLTPRLKYWLIANKVIGQFKAKNIVVLTDSDEMWDVSRLLIISDGTKLVRKRFNGNFKIRHQIFNKTRKWICRGVDCIVFQLFKMVQFKKPILLCDSKLTGFLSEHDKWSIVPILMDQSVINRLKLIRLYGVYIPYPNHKLFQIPNSKLWHEISKDRETSEFFTWQGLNFWNLVRDKLKFFSEYDFPRVQSYQLRLEGACCSKNISWIILRNEQKEFERILISSAKKMNIKSLVMQHGILAESNGHSQRLSTHYAAWGSFSREWFNQDSSIVITGNPAFDRLSSKKFNSKSEWRRRYGLDANKKIVLFVTQQVNPFSIFWTDDLFHAMLSDLLGALGVNGFQEFQLVVKIDPYEKMSTYNEMKKREQWKDVIVIHRCDLYQLMCEADIIVTLDSTAALEAMFLDKPVISYNLTGRKDRVPFSNFNAALTVTKQEELSRAIRSIFIDPEIRNTLGQGRQKFIEAHAHCLDGQSKQRLNAFLQKSVNL